MNYDKTIRIPGKIMLSGEYAVLKGARSLSFPVQFGQLFTFSASCNSITISTNYKGKQLFNGFFTKKGDIVTTSSSKQARFMEEVLKTIVKIMHKDLPPFNLEIASEYPLSWGLGSSSSFITGICRFLDIHPLSVNEKMKHSSGFDVATQWKETPVLYKKLPRPVLEEAKVDFPFANQLYFVWQGKKQSSKKSIQEFHKITWSKNELQRITTISQELLRIKKIEGFIALIEEHEKTLSKVLKMPVLQEKISAFEGIPAKSLGAWGGDFALLVWRESFQKLKLHLRPAGYTVVIPWSKMVLTNKTVFDGTVA